jgi:hypothetical protein
LWAIKTEIEHENCTVTIREQKSSALSVILIKLTPFKLA